MVNETQEVSVGQVLIDQNASGVVEKSVFHRHNGVGHRRFAAQTPLQLRGHVKLPQTADRVLHFEDDTRRLGTQRGQGSLVDFGVSALTNGALDDVDATIEHQSRVAAQNGEAAQNVVESGSRRKRSRQSAQLLLTKLDSKRIESSRIDAGRGTRFGEVRVQTTTHTQAT